MTARSALQQPLVLASASPRRRDILEQLGLSFRVIESAFDEPDHAGEAPAEYAARLAGAKAEAVAVRLAPQEPGTYVLGADTIVLIDGEVLGKPRDDAHATRMLRALAGQTHTVITAVALRRAGHALQAVFEAHTRVTFRALSERDIAGYVATGEGRDKAGSYAIQGVGTGLVRAVEGSYSNVVGLPASETLDLLIEHGALGAWP